MATAPWVRITLGVGLLSTLALHQGSSARAAEPPARPAAPAAAATPISTERQKPQQGREPGGLVAWWRRPDLCAELGISEALRQTLAPRLESMQTSYQMEQTRLNEARGHQTEMMLDPSADRSALAAFNRDQVVAPSDRMQSINFEARLYVRASLEKRQLETIARTHPSFFTAKWFQRAVVPVREGKVVVQEE